MSMEHWTTHANQEAFNTSSAYRTRHSYVGSCLAGRLCELILPQQQGHLPVRQGLPEVRCILCDDISHPPHHLPGSRPLCLLCLLLFCRCEKGRLLWG